VTNIEPPTGFMPVLICVFADWLEKIPRAAAKLANLRPGLRGIWVKGRPSYSDMAFCPQA